MTGRRARETRGRRLPARVRGERVRSSGNLPPTRISSRPPPRGRASQDELTSSPPSLRPSPPSSPAPLLPASQHGPRLGAEGRRATLRRRPPPWPRSLRTRRRPSRRPASRSGIRSSRASSSSRASMCRRSPRSRPASTSRRSSTCVSGLLPPSDLGSCGRAVFVGGGADVQLCLRSLRPRSNPTTPPSRRPQSRRPLRSCRRR